MKEYSDHLKTSSMVTTETQKASSAAALVRLSGKLDIKTDLRERGALPLKPGPIGALGF